MAGNADITLRIDPDGIIRDAAFGPALASEPPERWIGTSWEGTVTEPTRAKVRRLVADARASGVAGFRQVNHTLPSGAELAVEYTTVRTDPDGSVIAVGRSLQVVGDLQQRLVRAQQALERDHWRLREIETRYRMLFHRSPEAIFVVAGDSMRVVDANPAAEELLGIDSRRLTGAGRDLPGLLANGDRERVRERLRRTRETGRSSPLHLDLDGRPYVIRASLMSGDDESLILVHLSPRTSASSGVLPGCVDPGELLERIPDAMVVVDAAGDVAWANRRFLQLVQLRSPEEARGEGVTRWLGRPGADLTILRAMVERHGSVNRFSTQVLGEYGASTDVEISAVGLEGSDIPGGSPGLALLLRDVGRRLDELPSPTRDLAAAVDGLADELGRTSLRALVARTVELVERRMVTDALALTDGNRTAAAELLGLSRQGLYSKISRYGLDAGTGG